MGINGRGFRRNLAACILAGPQSRPEGVVLTGPLRTHFEEPLAGGPGCLLVPTARPARPDTSVTLRATFLRDPTLRECLHTIFCGGPWRGAASPEQFFQKSRFKPFKSNPINPEDACSRRFYKVVTPTDSGYGAHWCAAPGVSKQSQCIRAKGKND